MRQEDKGIKSIETISPGFHSAEQDWREEGISKRIEVISEQLQVLFI